MRLSSPITSQRRYRSMPEGRSPRCTCSPACESKRAHTTCSCKVNFATATSRYSFDEIEPALAEAWLGFVTQLFEQTQVSYTLNYQTAKFATAPPSRDYFWGAVQLSHSFDRRFCSSLLGPRTPHWPASGGPFFVLLRYDWPQKSAQRTQRKNEKMKASDLCWSVRAQRTKGVFPRCSFFVFCALFAANHSHSYP